MPEIILTVTLHLKSQYIQIASRTKHSPSIVRVSAFACMTGHHTPTTNSKGSGRQVSFCDVKTMSPSLLPSLLPAASALPLTSVMDRLEFFSAGIWRPFGALGLFRSAITGSRPRLMTAGPVGAEKLLVRNWSVARSVRWPAFRILRPSDAGGCRLRGRRGRLSGRLRRRGGGSRSRSRSRWRW